MKAGQLFEEAMDKGSLCSVEKSEKSAGLTILRKIPKSLSIPLTVSVR